MNLPIKRVFHVSIAILISTLSYAQKDSILPPFKRIPIIPPFDLLQVDSVHHLTKENIPKKHNTLILFFSPDCPHCQHQIEDLLAFMDKLKDVEIVMATYQPFQDMVDFNQKYHLGKYPNIKIGRDTKFFLPPFFRMKTLPYLALYDKKGILITTYEGNQTMANILAAFHRNDN